MASSEYCKHLPNNQLGVESGFHRVHWALDCIVDPLIMHQCIYFTVLTIVYSSSNYVILHPILREIKCPWNCCYQTPTLLILPHIVDYDRIKPVIDYGPKEATVSNPIGHIYSMW